MEKNGALDSIEFEDTAFSSIDFVGQCLIDLERTEAFGRTICSFAKPGLNVLDIGTGSGIMALFAAREGSNVTAIEYDKHIARIAKNNFDENKQSHINLMITDARNADFEKGSNFNVVIMEMLTTGMVDEFQVQAINNLHRKKVVDEKTIYIPNIQKTYATLVNVEYSILGFKMPMILHLWKWHNWKHLKIFKISDRTLISAINFNKPIDEKFSGVFEIDIKKDGVINSIQISSESVMPDKSVLGDTEALNAPVIIPVPETEVRAGSKVKINLSYIFGGGYNNLFVEIL